MCLGEGVGKCGLVHTQDMEAVLDIWISDQFRNIPQGDIFPLLMLQVVTIMNLRMLIHDDGNDVGDDQGDAIEHDNDNNNDNSNDHDNDYIIMTDA